MATKHAATLVGAAAVAAAIVGAPACQRGAEPAAEVMRNSGTVLDRVRIARRC